MPGNDRPKGHPERPDATDSQGHSHLSRRSLLGAAGVGAAGLAAGAFGGIAAAAPAIAAAKPARSAHSESAEQRDSGEQIIVHLRDARTGELDVFAGTSETRVHDPDLAARLLRTIR